MGLSTGRVKPKTIKSTFAVSLLSKQAALRGKNKDWLARNKDNLTQLRNMFTHELLHQPNHVGLVKSGHQHDYTECNLLSP